MVRSEETDPFVYFFQKFNTFIQEAVQYINNYTLPISTLSQSLYDLLLIWIHPQGVVKLVKAVAIQRPKSYVSHSVIKPEALVPSKRWVTYLKIQEVIEPDNSPQRKKIGEFNQVSSFKKEPFDQIKDQSEQQEESFKLKKQEGLSSEFSQNEFKLYKRGPYKTYTLYEKIKAVRLYRSKSLRISEISKHLGIPCKNIKRWATEGVSRKRGGGRKTISPCLQQDILKWLQDNYGQGFAISISEIQNYALCRSKDESFKASRSWAINFVERHYLRTLYNII